MKRTVRVVARALLVQLISEVSNAACALPRYKPARKCRSLEALCSPPSALLHLDSRAATFDVCGMLAMSLRVMHVVERCVVQ